MNSELDIIKINVLGNPFFDILSIIALLRFVDCFWLPKQSPRWFILHIFGNLIIIFYTFNDFWTMLSDPIKGVNTITSNIPMNITVAMHFYHMIFFDNLYFIDWLHHILMMFVAICSYISDHGMIGNCVLFSITGLPGMIDYILLVLLHYKKIHFLTEKQINSFLNAWIRGPGVLFGSYGFYLGYKYGNLDYQGNNILIQIVYYTIMILVNSIIFWNGQYFAYRVIGNYHTRKTEEKYGMKKKEDVDDNDEYDELKNTHLGRLVKESVN